VFRAVGHLLWNAIPPCHNIDVVIISAKYGFLRPNCPITHYDLEMTTELADYHRPSIALRISNLCSTRSYSDSLLFLEPVYLGTLSTTIFPSPIVVSEISEATLAQVQRWIQERKSN
jgi:hypothetical protein